MLLPGYYPGTGGIHRGTYSTGVRALYYLRDRLCIVGELRIYWVGDPPHISPDTLLTEYFARYTGSSTDCFPHDAPYMVM